MLADLTGMPALCLERTITYARCQGNCLVPVAPEPASGTKGHKRVAQRLT